MKNETTELVFILDRSGSMGGLEADTIGGFNSMIEKQKTEPGNALVTTVLFDHESETLHDRIALDSVPTMTDRDYFVRGSTALLDAVGETVERIRTIHRYARREDVPARTLFVITTDGMENASRKYSLKKVKELIEQQKKDDWEFLFLGANIDAVSAARDFGIDADRAVRYKSDKAGTRLNYEVMSEAVSCMRAARPLSADWKAAVEEDVAKRGQ